MVKRCPPPRPDRRGTAGSLDKATSDRTLQLRNRAVTGLKAPVLRAKVPFIRDIGI